MTNSQSTAHALRVANRASIQRRVPGGELRSADVALALARRKAAGGAVAAKLLAGLLSKRGAK